MSRRRSLVSTFAIASVALATAATPVGGRGTSRPLGDYLLFFGESAGRLWGDGRSGVAPDLDRPQDAGTWSVTPMPLKDGRLRIHVEVEPPGWTLPVDPGPAALVVSLALGGGFEGDMYRRHTVSVDAVPLSPCGDPCRFVADVSVDVHRLPALARRIDDFEGTSAEVSLTLVRSFAGGTWLQVVDGSGEGDAGQLGAPTPWTGTAPAVGLFPASTAGGGEPDPRPQPFDYVAAVEVARDAFADPTAPADSREVRFQATLDGCEEVGVTPNLGSRDGDRVAFGPSVAGDVDAMVWLPVGTTWRVEGDQAATPIVIEDHDLSVRVGHACVEDGAGDLVHQVSVHVEPMAVPTAAAPMAGATVTRRDVNDILVPVWDAVSIDGQPIVIPDDEFARIDGRRPTMSFARHGNDTWATGEGACNGWGAVVDVSFDGSFSIDEDGPWSTLVGCGEPREGIDTAFSDALRRAAHWDVAGDGTLTLLDDVGAAVLGFTEAPAPSLPGDYYLMSASDDGVGRVDLAAADLPIRVAITDRMVSASIGCNEMGGAYRQDGHRIEMEPSGPTMAWCDGLMDLESSLRAALLSTTTVHGGRHGAFVLLDGYGYERVRLARVDDPDIFGSSEEAQASIVGTSWTVRALRDPAVLDEERRPTMRDLEHDRLVLSFGEGSRIRGSTGCGELTGEFREARSWIAIEARPRRPCDDASLSWTESTFVDALSKAGTFHLGEWLTLRDGSGGTIVLLAEPRR